MLQFPENEVHYPHLPGQQRQPPALRLEGELHAILPHEGGESFALGAGFACPVHPGKPCNPSAVADVRGSATG